MVTQFALRTDTEADAPAADIIAFDRQVTIEDQDILAICDPDVPLRAARGGDARRASGDFWCSQNNEIRHGLYYLFGFPLH